MEVLQTRPIYGGPHLWGVVVKEGFWEEVAGVLIVDRILPTASVWRWTI